MKQLFKTLCIVVVIGTSFLFSARISEKVLYPVYATLYDYRRLTPELFPSPETLRIVSVGHHTTYADILWVNLVQFVGDNTGNNKYLDFSHAILSNITSLSPYFSRAYELDLLFTPLIYVDTKEDITRDERMKIERAIEHGKRGMKILCDEKKIEELSSLPYGKTLWSRKDLQNPCKNGMIPYYIGFHYSNDFEDGENASYYYKIASMQKDAPRATEFLGPIALASTNSVNPLDSAISFLLIAQDGYDREPYECRSLTKVLIEDIRRGRTLDDAWITEIESRETSLKDPKDNNIPESYSANNCYDAIGRGIKQIYVAYITEKAKGAPEITNARDLVQAGIIDKIPTITTQSGFTLRKRDGRWMFRDY